MSSTDLGDSLIQSVDRSARILLALQGARRLSLGELATRVNLPTSTVHGILKTLALHGMVEQEVGSSRYMLGPAVLRLSGAYLDNLEFLGRAKPWLDELARRTQSSVRAGVKLIDDVIIVHSESRPDGNRQMSEVGFVIPAHSSALGKALLAFSPPTQKSLASPTLRRMTAETIIDREELAVHLLDVAETGIATENDEALLGESSIAAPVFDTTGEAIAAVGIVFSSSEWPPAPSMRDEVRETARNISRELGAPSWPAHPREHDSHKGNSFG